MRILLDTSVLVAAMVEAHPAHSAALPWLQRAKGGIDTGLVAAHSLAELYAILTTLPVEPRILPSIALELIKHNVLDMLEVVFLSGDDYATLISRLAGLGIVGGATYDALILHAASKANVDQVITLNEKDFRRVYPELADRIVSP
ncbi:MAG: PIN domain-containing protein [Chloroflexi bacterium]|nr:PIN domain-containing protein [Chloroflexota bacterium]